jgi:hypothetical protein
MRRLTPSLAALGLLAAMAAPAVAKQHAGGSLSAPTGLGANVLVSSVGLHWDTVDGDADVVAVVRDGATVATLSPGARSYEDRAVAPGGTYVYAVIASASWGNGRGRGARHGTVSATSAPVRVTLPAYKVGAAERTISPDAAGLGTINLGGNGLGDGSGLSNAVGRGHTGRTTTETIKTRAVVFDDGKQAIAIASIETQGYFAKYRDGLKGLADMAAAAAQPGLPADHILIAADHTHSGPDTIGAWGGVPRSYFDFVYAQTVAAIRSAYASRRFADVYAGHSAAYDLIYNQSCPEALYQGGGLDPRLPPPPPGGETLPCPTGSAQGSNGTDGKDGLMRVVQARTPDGGVVVTYFAYAAHATAGGADGVHGDWPQYVADAVAARYGGVAIGMEGAVGKTQPCRPTCGFTKTSNPGYRLSDRKAAITANYLAHVTDAVSTGKAVHGPVAATQGRIREVITSPTVLGLFTAGGTAFGARLLRSLDPPWQNANTISTVVAALRVGDVLVAGTPGEAYPEIAFGIRDGVKGPREVVTLGLANDQLGYLIAPAAAYPVITAQVAVNDNTIFNVSPTIGDHVMCADIRLARRLGFEAGAVRYAAYCAPYDTADTLGDPIGAIPVGGISADDPPTAP